MTHLFPHTQMPGRVELTDNLSYYKNQVLGYEQVLFDGDQIKNLKTILARALNCWSEAPKELFELDQLLRFGEVLKKE